MHFATILCTLRQKDIVLFKIPYHARNRNQTFYHSIQSITCYLTTTQIFYGISSPEIGSQYASIFLDRLDDLLQSIENEILSELQEDNKEESELDLISRKLLELELEGSITLEQKSTLSSAISRLLHNAAARRNAKDVLHIQEMEARLDKIPTPMPLSAEISIPTVKISAKATIINSQLPRVFVAYGHNDAMKHAVARVIEKLELEPIILDEMTTSGNAIIEKLEKYSDVNYAVVLLSPDDMGYLKEDGPEKAKPRARQNVILELGLFMGMEKIKRHCQHPIFRTIFE